MRQLIRPDGVRLAFDVVNPDGLGPPLLLTHGFFATSRMWRLNTAALAADRPVLVWDLRGHGHSDAPEDPAAYSERIFVEDMAALLDAVAVDRAVLVGMSLGGYLSLAFHLAYPERVAALVLVDTGPGFRSATARDGWNQHAERMAQAIEAGSRTLDPARPESVAGDHLDPAGPPRVARHVMTQSDDRIIASVPTVAVPALVVVGERDVPFHGAADYLVSHIADAQRLDLSDAGHASNLDQPDLFNAGVTRFLANL